MSAKCVIQSPQGQLDIELEGCDINWTIGFIQFTFVILFLIIRHILLNKYRIYQIHISNLNIFLIFYQFLSQISSISDLSFLGCFVNLPH